MGNKYIIELEDKPFHNKDGDFLCRVKGFNSLVFDMTGISKLAHYHEPDLERTKKTAYDDGYSTGYQAGREDLNRVLSDVESDVEKVRKEAYAEGFKDGQYAERNGLTASYAQVHKIKIGDEVTAEHGGSTFTVTWMSDVCICGIDSDGRCYSYEINEVDGKTGNHHDIATVLERMRGEQDG